MQWYIIGLQQLMNGLALGSVYALIALGYTMVYGIIKLINFAHGEMYMLGAYFGFYAITRFNLSLGPAMLLAMVGAAFMGILLERIAYKPHVIFPYRRINYGHRGVSVTAKHGPTGFWCVIQAISPGHPV